ncbi:hypothetical protein D3C85_1535810 [compost metagenome]
MEPAVQFVDTQPAAGQFLTSLLGQLIDPPDTVAQYTFQIAIHLQRAQQRPHRADIHLESVLHQHFCKHGHGGGHLHGELQDVDAG